MSNPVPSRTAHEQHGHALRLARKLIALTLTYFSDNEEKALAVVRAHLMDLVDAKPSLTQGQNFRSIHTLLGRYADKFNQALQASLADELSQALKSALPEPAKVGRPVQPASDGMDGLHLSLIEVGDVERILTLDRIAQRFSARYEPKLEPLTQRVGALLGKESPSGADNPFHPLVLLRAFVKAWEQCEWDNNATEDLLSALAPASFLDLGPLYESLNDNLEKSGLSAQRTLTIRRSVGGANSSYAPLGDSSMAALEAASGPAPISSGAPLTRGAPLSGVMPLGRASQFAPMDGGARSAWAALAPAGRTVAAHARQFLQRMGLQSPTHTAATEASNEDGSQGHERPVMEAASPALMGYLEHLQANASQVDPGDVMRGLDPYAPNVLRQMRESEEIRSAPELDRGTVDALAEVFDFVFADHSIPMQMKVIIGRLQIPVLKAAMIDRDFFLSDQHPARRLVDTLAGASVTWAPEKGESDPLFVRIETTVQRVLTEFEDDLDLFSSLLRDFTEFLFESEQQVQSRVEPVATLEDKGESLEHARAQADELLHDTLRSVITDRPLLPFLLPFLTGPWRDVIARALIAPGDSDAAVKQALKTMKYLIWSTEPKTTPEQRKELVTVLPELVRELNVGLDAIEWDGEPRSVFTRRLITTHTLAIRMTQASAMDTRAAELETREGDKAMVDLEERRAARQAQEDDEFDALVHSFKRGMWFEFEVEAGTRGRCRLSWVSPMRTRLLFTNRDGFDAFVRSEREVAAMLRMQRLVVLAQEPIVGRALGKLMEEQDSEPALSIAA